MPEVSVVTLVNNLRMYATMRATLDEQFAPGGVQWIPIHADQFRWSASIGLNHGIAQATSSIIVCAHQDILFPPGWWARLSAQIASLPTKAAVFGLMGCRADGRFVGHTLDPHGHACFPPLPQRIMTVDEQVIVLRREAQLRFDPANPGFHCYGADIVLTARARGLSAYVVDAPVVHLSGGLIDDVFGRSAEWLLSKWGPTCGYVIPTCAKVISDPRRKNLLRLAWVYLGRRVLSKPGAMGFRRTYAVAPIGCTGCDAQTG